MDTACCVSGGGERERGGGGAEISLKTYKLDVFIAS